ncbi:hypothetical protein RHMOL_Rhmol11G0080100 [Rhododendron molle]|uniref:Uncharacterized protein n=1 Tax=Rhododendron molle TaxID=49168 RepID=A0ACC0LQ87_RHOML|nr:hypothetical protein RHMOL_Rhmol11G0080100 [Rhododendron molle]
MPLFDEHILEDVQDFAMIDEEGALVGHDSQTELGANHSMLIFLKLSGIGSVLLCFSSVFTFLVGFNVFWFWITSEKKSQVNGMGLLVSHLLFADDTLLFCDADPTQVGYLRCVLLCFEVVSGLKVNLGKSEMIPIGVVEDIGDIAQLLGCKVVALPVSYLGLLLGSSYKAKAVWHSVEERFQKRLASWKRLYIPKGGRVTLIKNTFSSLPIYFMSLFVIPAFMAKRLEKIQRDFWWSGVGEESKYHLVEWDKVCTPMREGSLGVRRLKLFNQALLGKWLWRFACERERWCRKIIVAKYGCGRGEWASLDVRTPYGMALWRGIMNGWEAFGKNTRRAVGDGRRVKFWEHVWCGDACLKETFPNIYLLACDRDAKVCDYLHVHNGVTVWDIRLGRDVCVEEAAALMSRIEVVKLSSSGCKTPRAVHIKFLTTSSISMLDMTVSVNFDPRNHMFHILVIVDYEKFETWGVRTLELSLWDATMHHIWYYNLRVLNQDP